jgi:acyl-CoA synthetase (AMP-forming)/AMP-acid ligase II
MIEPVYETLGDALADQAARHGDKVALTFGSRTTTYAEFDRVADRIAAVLRHLGLGNGAVAGILARNSDRYAQILFGCARAPSLALAMNWRLARPELEFVTDDSHAGIIFFDPEFAEEARNLKQRNPELVIVSTSDEPSSEMSFQEFLAIETGATGSATIDRHTPAVVMYTSGSTGKPKGAILSHFSLLHNISLLLHTNPPTAIRNDDVVLISTPLFHIGALVPLMGVVAFGAHAVITAEARLTDTMQAVAQHGVTRAVIAPVLMPQLIENANSGMDLSSLRSILYGMSAIPESVLTGMIETFKCSFLQHYGLTEGGGLTELGPADHYPGSPRLASCGRPLPDVEISIRRPDNSEASVGETGEVLYRSPSVAIGYWRDGKLEPTGTRDGWFESGDIGYRDEEGFIFLCDRKKDMIVTGGENVFSPEVESIISTHPDVERVAIIGIPSEKWGEEVKAVIIPKAGTSPSAQDIIEFARKSLAGYKIPKSVDFVDAMPVTGVGKIAKAVLREPYWRGFDRRIN